MKFFGSDSVAVKEHHLMWKMMLSIYDLQIEYIQESNCKQNILSSVSQGSSKCADLPPHGQLKKAVERLMSENHDKVQKVSQALQRAQAQANSTQGSLKACNQLLERQQKEAADLKDSISETINNNYDQVGLYDFEANFCCFFCHLAFPIEGLLL